MYHGNFSRIAVDGEEFGWRIPILDEHGDEIRWNHMRKPMKNMYTMTGTLILTARSCGPFALYRSLSNKLSAWSLLQQRLLGISAQQPLWLGFRDARFTFKEACGSDMDCDTLPFCLLGARTLRSIDRYNVKLFHCMRSFHPPARLHIYRHSLYRCAIL
jgi:hypothetical protein